MPYQRNDKEELRVSNSRKDEKNSSKNQEQIGKRVSVNSKKKRRKKKRRVKRIKTRFGIVAFVLIGGTSLVAGLGKTRVDKTFKGTKFEKLLDEKKDDTYLDEILSTSEETEINELENYVQLSEEMHSLKEDVEEIIGENLSEKKDDKNISVEDISEQINNPKYSADTMAKVVSKLKKGIEDVKEGNINFKAPTKETQDFYDLCYDVYGGDLSYEAICNEKIAKGYKAAYNLIEKNLFGAYLKSSDLKPEDVKNLSYDPEKKVIVYTDENFSKFGAKKFEFPVKYSGFIFGNVIGDNFIDTLEELDKQINRYDNESDEKHTDYNKDRNEIILKALEEAKKMLYYDYQISGDNLGEDETSNFTASFNRDEYIIRGLRRK